MNSLISELSRLNKTLFENLCVMDFIRLTESTSATTSYKSISGYCKNIESALNEFSTQKAKRDKFGIITDIPVTESQFKSLEAQVLYTCILLGQFGKTYLQDTQYPQGSKEKEDVIVMFSDLKKIIESLIEVLESSYSTWIANNNIYLNKSAQDLKAYKAIEQRGLPHYWGKYADSRDFTFDTFYYKVANNPRFTKSIINDVQHKFYKKAA